MLSIQKNSPTFSGKFRWTERFETRVKEASSPAKLEKLDEALKRMSQKNDRKIYTYFDETKIHREGLMDESSTTSLYILGRKCFPNILKERVISSEEMSGDKAIDFICAFIDKYYPKKHDNEKIRKNILEKLDYSDN